jgi:hypothetical protein
VDNGKCTNQCVQKCFKTTKMQRNATKIVFV